MLRRSLSEGAQEELIRRSSRGAYPSTLSLLLPIQPALLPLQRHYVSIVAKEQRLRKAQVIGSSSSAARSRCSAERQIVEIPQSSPNLLCFFADLRVLGLVVLLGSSPIQHVNTDNSNLLSNFYQNPSLLPAIAGNSNPLPPAKPTDAINIKLRSSAIGSNPMAEMKDSINTIASSAYIRANPSVVLKYHRRSILSSISSSLSVKEIHQSASHPVTILRTGSPTEILCSSSDPQASTSSSSEDLRLALKLRDRQDLLRRSSPLAESRSQKGSPSRSPSLIDLPRSTGSSSKIRLPVPPADSSRSPSEITLHPEPSCSSR